MLNVILVSLVGSFVGTIVGYTGMTLVLGVMAQREAKRRSDKVNAELAALREEMQTRVYAALASEALQDATETGHIRAEA